MQKLLWLLSRSTPDHTTKRGFHTQLILFHSANFKRNRRNKGVRAFYVERAVREVLNGDGSAIETDMFAKYPRTPSDSTHTTPFPQRRRRIRCKMCRQELATREHMIDHGQVGASTPGTATALSPANSRRPSTGETIVVSKAIENGEQTTVTVIRRSNSDSVRRPSFGSSLIPMTPIHALDPVEQRGSFSEAGQKLRRPFAGLSMTPMSESPTESDSNNEERLARKKSISKAKMDPHSTSAIESDDEEGSEKFAANTQPFSKLRIFANNSFSSPRELAAQIHPALSELRSASVMSTLAPTGTTAAISVKQEACGNKQSLSLTTASPPLLLPHAKCSGYFVEPMKWMDPFLEGGNIAGKIICPNKKCNAKLGNYDWAGVECSCKHWVVPGFCIHKSKVDEVVI